MHSLIDNGEKNNNYSSLTMFIGLFAGYNNYMIYLKNMSVVVKKNQLSKWQSFKAWLVKGTILEEWTPYEELMSRPEIQEEIKEIKAAFRKAQKNNSKQSA